ncbi:hypothetical protein CWATWH0402_2283 [Crocosphaera watsonii WH 0402]|uniref:Uncharacterized protein n=2 Tax=Crocosphaera watsonii TaxID=263511 RepID=T2JV24_CROWT|nr:hypothetical protein CWATWH0402_2283 [Crocosphaera watsonii WH 0402]
MINQKNLFYFLIIFPMLLFGTTANSGSTIVYFATEMWPGEGIPRFKAKQDIIPFSEPRKDSKKVEGLQINKGEMIEFTQTLFKSVKTGTVTISRTIQFEATNYGTTNYLSKHDYYNTGENLDLTLNEGDVLTVFMPRAEGHLFFKFKGEVYSGLCEPCGEADFKTEWWLKIEQNLKSGWILKDSTSIEDLGRSF